MILDINVDTNGRLVLRECVTLNAGKSENERLFKKKYLSYIKQRQTLIKYFEITAKSHSRESSIGEKKILPPNSPIRRRTSHTHTHIIEDDVEDVSFVQAICRHVTERDVRQMIGQLSFQRVGAHAKRQMHQHILAHPLVTGQKTTVGL